MVADSTIIYYFSGTGNSLYIARQLSNQLPNAKLEPIAQKINTNSLASPSASSIGLVFPVYMWGLPHIIKRFVKARSWSKEQYIFAIATNGGMVGTTLVQLASLLKKQGGKLSAGFSIPMPGNYTPMYGALPPEKQNKLFQKALQKLEKIKSAILNRQQVKIEKSFFLFNWLFCIPLHYLSSPWIPKMDKGFRVSANCNHCGICVQVCPVNNIKLEAEKKPIWLHHCEQCYACLQWCPTEAIQYYWITKGRKRYHQPEIKVKDIINSK